MVSKMNEILSKKVFLEKHFICLTGPKKLEAKHVTEEKTTMNKSTINKLFQLATINSTNLVVSHYIRCKIKPLKKCFSSKIL